MVATLSLAFVATTAFLASIPTPSNHSMDPLKKIERSSSSMPTTQQTQRGPFSTHRHLHARQSPDEAAQQLQQLTQEMNDRVGQPFTTAELEGVVQSLQNVMPAASDSTLIPSWDEPQLRALLRDAAHLSHKDWNVTGANAARLGQILFPNDSNTVALSTPAPSHDNDDDDDPAAGAAAASAAAVARQMLERILREGNWNGAAAAAIQSQQLAVNEKPWAVLVTGVK